MTFQRVFSQFRASVLKTMHSRAVTIVLVLSWMMMSLYYYNIFNLVGYRFDKDDYSINVSRKSVGNKSVHRSKEVLLIDTPGCSIPDYSRSLKFKESPPPNPSCGNRAVFINKIKENTIEFTINKSVLEMYTKKKGPHDCFYKFVSRSTVVGNEDEDLYYTPSKKFRNGTRIPLEREVITVICYSAKNKTVPMYEDSYMLVKQVKRSKQNGTVQKLNVLLLGMDTMSRGRAFSSMPKTVKYLQHNKWLDYRGYQKVAFNTFPNIMSMLTGKKMSNIYHECAKGMSSCNELIMWSKYKKAGYVTAYGEDYLRLPDTFHPYKGFKTPPTDHYMRPLYLTKETNNKGTICTKKLPSGKHMLNYAAEFAKAYKNDGFFGLFWMNSYSHNLDNVPTLIDEPMVQFFKILNSTGVLQNTFVVFFSDHGIRFGDMRYPVESYYEERLPMFFMLVPQKFQKSNPAEYAAAVTNQLRLTTPYDLHMTLNDILRVSDTSSVTERSEACPECTSFFVEKPATRTCADAKVDEKWCSCHSMKRASESDDDAKQSLALAVSYIQNVSQSVQTVNCMRCHNFTLKTVLRIHSYVNEDNANRSYFVVAFVMDPGGVAYEANVFKENDKFEIISPTETISAYNVRGSCVKHPPDRAFCVCDETKCK